MYGRLRDSFAGRSIGLKLAVGARSFALFDANFTNWACALRS